MRKTNQSEVCQVKYTANCSIIGSFRKHFDDILTVLDLFQGAGIRVLSPKRSAILNPIDEFVRLQSDPSGATDDEIESNALSNITRSDFVYVLCPGGYVGRTTCYELGWVYCRSIPVYFSHAPFDLPISVPRSMVVMPESLVHHVLNHGIVPSSGSK